MPIPPRRRRLMLEPPAAVLRRWLPCAIAAAALSCSGPRAGSAPVAGGAGAVDAPRRAAIERAVRYLADEVPRWHRDNGCHSCHHNGDAVRALLAARSRGFAVPDAAIEESLAWLGEPAEWHREKGDPAFQDPRLASLQFGVALASARAAGAAVSPDALRAAARDVARHPAADGSFEIDPQSIAGTPATWGRHLATALSLRALDASPDAASPDDEARAAAARARAWLDAAPARNNLEAAALLLSEAGGDATRRRAAALIAAGESDGGGWGPWPRSAPEVFDTAVVTLALAKLLAVAPDDALAARRRRGLELLVERQSSDGSWVETLRMGGAESLAQRVSTTAWATLALLEP